jgi:hypothetical protein
MESPWSIPMPREIRKRARQVRNTWSAAERQARRTSLPPDSLLRSLPMRLWVINASRQRLTARPRMV